MSDMQEVAPYRTEVEVLAPGAFAVISGEPFPRDWEMYQTLSIVLEEEGRYEVFWGDDEIRVNKLEA